VNGILKEHWGRPRPIDVVEFGGTKQYVDWWKPTGACERNCSFVSGEGATAAWMFGPAMIVPAPWRGLALAAAAVFTATMSGLRMSVGAHFFTDVLFGALSTMLLLLAMRAWTDRWLGPARDSRRPIGRGTGSSRAQPTA
jgi:membrane-associated phospholipid phosphatase